MASSIFRHAMKRQISPSIRAPCVGRSIHSSAAALAPFRQRRIVDLLSPEDQGEMMDATPQDDDTPSAGHLALDHYREVAYYLRLIEHDMPRLVAFRKEFVPPDVSKPVIVRSVHYAGEEHPVTAKRVIVVPVGDLPLRNEAAVHKFKVLAGTRWTPQPPADAGASGLRGWGEGFIKISCERFPQAAMNMKWASDVLDRLVVEANDPTDTFKKVPVDLRHVYSKLRKSKKGHRRGRFNPPPSLNDFPMEWLPESSPSVASEAPVNS